MTTRRISEGGERGGWLRAALGCCPCWEGPPAPHQGRDRGLQLDPRSQPCLASKCKGLQRSSMQTWTSPALLAAGAEGSQRFCGNAPPFFNVSLHAQGREVGGILQVSARLWGSSASPRSGCGVLRADLPAGKANRKISDHRRHSAGHQRAKPPRAGVGVTSPFPGVLEELRRWWRRLSFVGIGRVASEDPGLPRSQAGPQTPLRQHPTSQAPYLHTHTHSCTGIKAPGKKEKIVKSLYYPQSHLLLM